MKTWSNILLGLWLILAGLIRLGGVFLPRGGVLLAVLGIVTGILFVVTNSGEKLGAQAAGILLGVWLVAGGVVSLFHLRFAGSGVILAVLGVAAGVMVLIARR